jgi:hypothetical protein
MKPRRKWYGGKTRITPFAPQAFYTFFLRAEGSELVLMARCAQAFLAVCDSVYVYRPERSPESSGMAEVAKEARRNGTDIRNQEATEPEGFDPVVPAPIPKNVPDGRCGIDGGPLKRVFVCTPLRGTGSYNETTLENTLKRNTQIALQCCRKLALTENVAPFAPHAFYPFFYPFLKSEFEVDPNLYNDWFDRSIEVIKLCDAVYFFTEDGLHYSGSLSAGMIKVKDLADRLGLECRYCLMPKTVDETWVPATPNFLRRESTPG